MPDWRGVHVWFADERCVGPDDPQSNARLVRETLVAPGAVTHRMQGELGAEAAASAYERELADVVLDIVLLGHRRRRAHRLAVPRQPRARRGRAGGSGA